MKIDGVTWEKLCDRYENTNKNFEKTKVNLYI